MTGAADSRLAYIALGANLPGAEGTPVATLQAAVQELQRCSSQSLRVSAFYLSDPKDCPPGSPVYVNAVAALVPRPGETPHSLLRKLQRIESSHGRIRSGLRNEARTLDLDLLAFGVDVCNTPDLILPHPRAHERRFVLEPWIEIAGHEWKLNGKTLGQWEAECRDPVLHRLDKPGEST